MKRCIYCGKSIEDNEPLCPKCGRDMNPASMSEDDIHFARQHAYREVTINENKKDAAMTCFVIGGILLILGLVFLVLSFRFNTAKIRVFRPASVEFVVSIILLGISTILLTIGTIVLTTSVKIARFYKGVIRDLNGR